MPGVLECFAPISMATLALCVPGTCLPLIPVCWVEHLLLGIGIASLLYYSMGPVLHCTLSPHFVGFPGNPTRSSRLFQSPCSIVVWALRIILPTVSGTLLGKYSTGGCLVLRKGWQAGAFQVALQMPSVGLSLSLDARNHPWVFPTQPRRLSTHLLGRASL